MSDWPNLSIVIITYNRRDIVRETIHRIDKHLYYEGERHWILADDGSDDGTIDMVMSEYPHVSVVQSNRVGLGANSNAGLRAAFSKSDYVLQMQDDMHLLTTLDLHPHVGLMMNDDTCGYVRLWGIGGHRYTATLEGNHWRVRWDSQELYVPSDRPHVKHRRFHDKFGFYPEGLPTAATEEAWCHQCKTLSADANLDVFVPQMDTERSWEHAGWHTRWRDQGL